MRPGRLAATGAAVIGVGFLIMAGVFAFAEAADHPLPPCTETSTSACSGDPADHMRDGVKKDSLPVCVTEDSENCHWDADVQGNGRGDSYVRLDGVTYLLTD
ncbi:hypothetical protein SEA_FIZZLES_102 [Microbacterium phage Fizzles]|nr:hypothetical protein SEA_FIZZLES_102 [Microbacterium phage Fizzles]